MSRLLSDAQRGRDRLGHCAGITHRSQFDHAHAVREVADDARGDLQRQPRLADPADTGQRHHPMCL